MKFGRKSPANGFRVKTVSWVTDTEILLDPEDMLNSWSIVIHGFHVFLYRTLYSEAVCDTFWRCPPAY